MVSLQNIILLLGIIALSGGVGMYTLNQAHKEKESGCGNWVVQHVKDNPDDMDMFYGYQPTTFNHSVAYYAYLHDYCMEKKLYGTL